VQGSVGPKVLGRLARGVELDDGPAAAARVGLLERVPGGSLIEITITEGRKHQVRRMFEAVGHPVTRLVRRAIGPLELGRLKPGDHRRLGPVEVQALYRASETTKWLVDDLHSDHKETSREVDTAVYVRWREPKAVGKWMSRHVDR
jgi:16S rRNA U516 pseudouridylate synthase RsuA-like enzyme